MSVPNGFHYREGELYCEGVPAARIAEEHGTPCYVYSATALTERFRCIRDAFASWEALVCFSVKSCSNLSILKLLSEQGSGFDVVSGGELYRALEAGAEPGRIVFAGAGKTAEEIQYALDAGIHMFNVESRPELERLSELADSEGTAAPVCLRLNPDIEPGTHRKTATGKGETKFGIGIEETERLLAEAADWPGVNLRGIHLHLGSPVHSTEPYERALEKTSALFERADRNGLLLDCLNMGGGYGISYTGEEVIGPDDYARAVQSYLEKLGCSVIIEPGRYIAGNSGLLLTRVIYRKENEYGKRFLVCDAAMNDLVRPTLYGSYHRIWPVRSPSGMPAVMRPGDSSYDEFTTEVVDVVGPVCETGDYLAQNRPLPPLEGHRLLAVFSAGAYGFTMSSNYNSRPRPPEVLVEGDGCRLVRRREIPADLVEPERPYL